MRFAVPCFDLCHILINVRTMGLLCGIFMLLLKFWLERVGDGILSSRREQYMNMLVNFSRKENWTWLSCLRIASRCPAGLYWNTVDQSRSAARAATQHCSASAHPIYPFDIICPSAFCKCRQASHSDAGVFVPAGNKLCLSLSLLIYIRS